VIHNHSGKKKKYFFLLFLAENKSEAENEALLRKMVLSLTNF
jgi:hypothetical protein